MTVSNEKPLIKRLSCHVLPLTFVVWCAYFYLAGGGGIFFGALGSYPALLVTKISFIERLVEATFANSTPIWWQWSEILLCGYTQWLAINFLLLKGNHLTKRWLSYRPKS